MPYQGSWDTPESVETAAVPFPTTQHHQPHDEGKHGHDEPILVFKEWFPRFIRTPFTWILIAFQILLIILMFSTTEYAHHDQEEFVQMYPMFQDVHVMIYIGFGFLMTFLARYSWSAVGFTFLISALATQWAILTRNFWERVIITGVWEKIPLNVEQLCTAEFAAGSFLISYGAVLGRFTSAQLVVMMILHIIGYALVEALAFRFNAVDPGGAMVLHAYGAYFGLVVSWVAQFRKPAPPGEAGSSRVHALFAMIGTVFLFMFWPSFNAAIAKHTEVVVVNTYLSLTGSVVGAFFISWAFRHGGVLKFDMEDIQNATLAGGVVMGSASDFLLTPGAALLIGCITGVISCTAFVFLGPALHRIIGLHDTCGVHNLHAIPGVLGGIAGVIAAAAVANKSEQACCGRTDGEQALVQLGTLGVVLVVAAVWGAVTGLVMRLPIFDKPRNALYEDGEGTAEWIVHDVATGFEIDAEAASENGQTGLLADHAATVAAAAASRVSHPSRAGGSHVSASGVEAHEYDFGTMIRGGPRSAVECVPATEMS